MMLCEGQNGLLNADIPMLFHFQKGVWAGCMNISLYFPYLLYFLSIIWGLGLEV